MFQLVEKIVETLAAPACGYGKYYLIGRVDDQRIAHKRM
jgi:hypothetical protein